MRAQAGCRAKRNQHVPKMGVIEGKLAMDRLGQDVSIDLAWVLGVLGRLLPVCGRKCQHPFEVRGSRSLVFCGLLDGEDQDLKLGNSV